MHALLESLRSMIDLAWLYLFHASWQSAVAGTVVLALVLVGRRRPAPLRYVLLDGGAAQVHRSSVSGGSLRSFQPLGTCRLLIPDDAVIILDGRHGRNGWGPDDHRRFDEYPPPTSRQFGGGIALLGRPCSSSRGPRPQGPARR